MTYSKVSAIKGRKDLILFINNRFFFNFSFKYYMKKFTSNIYIYMNRLVECESIKRAID